MKEDDLVLERQDLNEVGALVNIANWFQNQLLKSQIKTGQAEIKKFTNENMKQFARHMGRNAQDWPTVTMRVVYTFMRLMKLQDDDIVFVVNQVLKDPSVNGKRLNLNQIKDQTNSLLVSSLSKIPNLAQVIAEKFIASAALRFMQNAWEQEAEPQLQSYNKPEQTKSAITTIRIPNLTIDEIDEIIEKLEA